MFPTVRKSGMVQTQSVVPLSKSAKHVILQIRQSVKNRENSTSRGDFLPAESLRGSSNTLTWFRETKLFLRSKCST